MYSEVRLSGSPHPQECCVLRGPARARTMAYFGEGKGPIHVDNVKCTGNERSLADCIKQDIGRHNCRHSEDAGVICDYFSKKAAGDSNRGKTFSGACTSQSTFNFISISSTLITKISFHKTT